MRPLLAALVALLVAGCVTPPGTPPTATTPVSPEAYAWAARAAPFGEGHDHFDLEQHQGLSTPNFEVLAWDPLLVQSQGNASAGGYFCGEATTTQEGRKLAVVNSYTTNVAFVLVDLTDTAAPKVLSEYTLTGGFAYDVALTPDGQHVVIANDPDRDSLLPGLGLAARAPPTLRARDPCTGEQGPEQMLPLGPSTLLVGVKDPANPTLEDAVPAPVMGPHSVSTAQVDGRTFVVSSITNIAHQGSYYQIFLLGSSPTGGARLDLQAVYQAPPPPGDAVPTVNGHVDASIQKHPVTGQVLAYLADWDAGMIVLDITDPRVPKQLSTFSEFEGGSYLTGEQTGNLHETYPLPGLWDGRHYVLAGQEVLGRPQPDLPTGKVWIIDDTDPTKLELVGTWTLPVDVEWSSDALTFSTHYVAVVNRTMFVTMYHGGLWAVDLSSADKLADPPTIGVFLPDRASPNPPRGGGHGVEGAPTVLDVLPFADGTMAVFDALSGVYLVRFDEGAPQPAPPTWTEQQAAG